MKRKHQRTLEQVFARPVSANVRWADIEALFVELGGQVAQRDGRACWCACWVQVSQDG